MKERKLLKIREVAQRMQASVKTVRRRIAEGKFEAHKEGGRLLVEEEEFLRYWNGATGGGES
ncbi:MAG: helix-turn-helix domain-containing protein [Verrucomicrobiota bacterium]